MFISPKTILQDFLRHRLTDPRGRAEESKTETFDGSFAEYILSPDSGKKFYSIEDVQIGGTSQDKWKDYYIDMQNSKVIFYSATPSGSDNISITYKQGTTNWVYKDKSREDLSLSSFPRVDILLLPGTGSRLGRFDSDIQTALSFQIDIWTKEKQVFTIGNHKYEGDKLSEYIAWQVTKAFEDYISEIDPQLYNYTLLQSPRDMSFDRDMQCFRHIVEVELNSLNTGEA